ncbi:hypothetical protein [uncultured Draconibacterium sp.]|uniref:hypothetical protein n=1 Tax=uncultured Draconibacterium sp. TaxID=1573823 RepID=UPI003217702A
MSFTVKIDGTSPKARSIINMLKELAEDYSFLSILEDKDELPDNIAQELDARYEYLLKHPEEGESWDKVKKDLLNS